MKKVLLMLLFLSVKGYSYDCKPNDLETAYKVQFKFACSDTESSRLISKIIKKFPKFLSKDEKNYLSLAMMVINDNSLELDKIENIEITKSTQVKLIEGNENYNIYTIYIKFVNGNIKRFQIGDNSKIDPLNIDNEAGVGLLDQ